MTSQTHTQPQGAVWGSVSRHEIYKSFRWDLFGGTKKIFNITFYLFLRARPSAAPETHICDLCSKYCSTNLFRAIFNTQCRQAMRGSHVSKPAKAAVRERFTTNTCLIITLVGVISPLTRHVLIRELVFLQRVGTDVFSQHAGIFYWNSLNGHVGRRVKNTTAWIFSDGDSCVSSAQLPYLLLNSTGTDPKTRMHPVFFGESIEVNPTPEQEIK